jgi:large subunit ribosomal protein L13
MATKVYNLKDTDRKWYVLDADGAILGRLSTVAADLLRGKNKATYTPNMDSGDHVIVLNASKVILSTEAKNQDKMYYRHSGYPGGMKKESFAEAMVKHPERVISLAVKGMLPVNKLRAQQLKRLRVYPGNVHKHTQPMTEVDLKGETK